MGKALVLPDQQPHVLDLQAADRLAPKFTHGRHQPGFTARRGRSAVVLKLLKGAVTVHETGHRPIVPSPISSPVPRSQVVASACVGVRRDARTDG